jgi:cytochrome c-type biogenesis protein CcmH/NrfG
MRSDSIVFAVAGICFGIILGWVIGTEQAGKRAGTVVQMQSAAAAQPADAQPGAAPAPPAANQPPPLDDAKVQGLMTIIKSDPKNAGAQVQLANTYFDAQRYDDAIKWYEEGLKLDPKNVDASTDLGVSYFYSNRTDEALRQFDYSLKINPTHTKTLLNQGIVLAFGKRDMKGATAAWEKVVQLAPNSPEAQAAKQGLQGIAAAGRGGAPAPTAGG